MKFLAVLSTVLCSSAFAASATQTIAQLDTGNGTFSVQSNGQAIAKNAAGSVQVARPLAQLTFNKISGLAYELANAKVEQTYSQMICYTFIFEPQSSLEVSPLDSSNVFSGDLRTILAGEGCSVHEHTAPADAQLAAAAQKLMELLEVVNAEVLQVRQ